MRSAVKFARAAYEEVGDHETIHIRDDSEGALRLVLGSELCDCIRPKFDGGK